MDSLYIFLDESGNFDFSKKGTKHFVLTATSMQRPFPWESELNELRYDIWESNPHFDIEYFHASEDKQRTRDKVFSIIQKHLTRFRVDSVVVEKPKTHPSLQPVERFYPKMMGYLLRYVLDGYSPDNYSDVKIITDRIPVKKKRRAVEKAVSTNIQTMVNSRHEYQVSHRDSKSCYSLQVADYFSWAIYKKWEAQNTLSYETIQSAVFSEFDIFRAGSTYFYEK